MIEISIITINYNGLADTCALIETIPNNDNLEVIVVESSRVRKTLALPVAIIWALKLHKVNISSSSTTIRFLRTSMSKF